jgi:uncharacterized protein YgiM (DUF1202 family)
LVEAMQRPGLSAEHVFKRVRIAVMAETGERQVPWEESSLTGDFYFTGGPTTIAATPAPQVAAEPAPPVTAPAEIAARSTPTQDPESATPPPVADQPVTPSSGDDADELQVELAFWESIKDSQDPADFQAYLETYPNGRFAALARRRMTPPATRQHAVAVPAPVPGFAVEPIEYWYVTVKNANVRRYPTAQSALITTVPRGSFVFATGKVRTRNWLRVNLNGTTGYVYAALLRPPPPPQPQAVAPTYPNAPAPPRYEVPDFFSTLNNALSSASKQKAWRKRRGKKRKDGDD